MTESQKNPSDAIFQPLESKHDGITQTTPGRPPHELLSWLVQINQRARAAQANSTTEVSPCNSPSAHTPSS